MGNPGFFLTSWVGRPRMTFVGGGDLASGGEAPGECRMSGPALAYWGTSRGWERGSSVDQVRLAWCCVAPCVSDYGRPPALPAPTEAIGAAGGGRVRALWPEAEGGEGSRAK